MRLVSLFAAMVALAVFPVVTIAFSVPPSGRVLKSPLLGTASRHLPLTTVKTRMTGITGSNTDSSSKRVSIKKPVTRGIAAALGVLLLAPRRAAARAAAASASSSKVLLGQEFNGCIGIMGAYGLLLYIFMLISASVPEGATDGHETWASRIFYNTLEQSPVFLMSFWIHAASVSTATATLLGKIYLGITMWYAFLRLYAKGELPIPLAPFTSTLPRYAINLFLLGTAVSQRCWGVDVVAKYFGGNMWLALGAICISWIFTFIGLSTLQEKLLKDYFSS